MLPPFSVGPRGRTVYLTAHDKKSAEGWVAVGFTEALRTPDSTLDFRDPTRKALEIRTDQIGCMGCLKRLPVLELGAERRAFERERRADPRSYCIQKTLQAIRHSDDVECQLMFCGSQCLSLRLGPVLYGTAMCRPSGSLVERLQTGD